MLWFGLTLLLCVVGVITWLLLAPLQLQIDTPTNAYWLRWKGIASARLIPLADDLLIRLQIFFWQFDYYPLHPKPKARPQKTLKAKTRPKPKKRSWSSATMDIQKWKRRGLRMLRSFTVKRFRLRLDTGDYVRNSYLYPVFFFLSTPKRQMSINYNGATDLELEVENRLYRLVYAFFF
jgi:hypothetical protein